MEPAVATIKDVIFAFLHHSRRQATGRLALLRLSFRSSQTLMRVRVSHSSQILYATSLIHHRLLSLRCRKKTGDK